MLLRNKIGWALPENGPIRRPHGEHGKFRIGETENQIRPACRFNFRRPQTVDAARQSQAALRFAGFALEDFAVIFAAEHNDGRTLRLRQREWSPDTDAQIFFPENVSPVGIQQHAAIIILTFLTGHAG